MVKYTFRIRARSGMVVENLTVHARDTLRAHVGEENFFHFGLCRESTNVPLGWVLSGSTRRNMNSQLAGDRCETADTPPHVFFDNRGSLELLRQRGG